MKLGYVNCMSISRIYSLLFALALLPALSGCITLATSAAGEGVVVAAQERSAGRALDDAGILVSLKEQYLRKDAKDLFANVIVKVVEGRVLLTGNVDKPETQVEAVRIAWTVDGVREVINEIQVNDQSSLLNYSRDVWISTQVRTKLLVTKGIRSVNYSVITVNQVVYLTGIAQDQAELDRATTVASTTPYVQKVVSYVRLKTDPHRPY